MQNKAILVGRLGNDPEDAVGNKPLTFSLATSEKWRNKTTGDRHERTEWHRVVVFQKAASEFAARYLKKGSLVYIEGSIATRKWTDKNGVDRYSTEILVRNFNHCITSVERSKGGGYASPEGEADYGYNDSHSAPTGTGYHDTPPQGEVTTQFDQRELDDEIPF